MMSDNGRPPDGLNWLANGRLTPYLARQLGLSEEGCGYRGSLYCLRCPWARYTPRECEYRCVGCVLRHFCRCGHTSQTVRIEAWFRIGEFSEEAMNNPTALPVGQLRRFEVKGSVILSWYCDCPDCQSSHSKMFYIRKRVLDMDEERAVEQAVKGLGYDYEQIEWEEGPEVRELPFGEDERMRLLGAPELLAV